MLFCLSLPAQAENIDLQCQELARQMISRLTHEGLLNSSRQTAERAHQITVSLCARAQQSAQQQHEEGKQRALTDWLWQERPETRGHC